jgi:hypothetical protein
MISAAPITLRLATSDDATAVADIWQKGVASSLGFEADLPEVEPFFRHCIQERSGTSKVWVATDHVGRVIGWQSRQHRQAAGAAAATEKLRFDRVREDAVKKRPQDHGPRPRRNCNEPL